MNNSEDFLNESPFPPMKWTKYEWWEGQGVFPAWRGFQSRGGSYGSLSSDNLSSGSATVALTPADASVSRLPSPAQRHAFEHQLEHGEAVVTSVLMALRSYYKELRPRWITFFGEDEANRIMPAVSRPDDFRALMGLHQVHVHPWEKSGMAYVGLEFGCTWDGEHGFGVVLHGNQILDVGSADISFTWCPDEADE